MRRIHYTFLEDEVKARKAREVGKFRLEIKEKGWNFNQAHSIKCCEEIQDDAGLKTLSC